ncbi:MAG TPA: FAD-dependent thymidylate synthase [Dehalococcoidia bacterium]|nr:FAD-dependent thymidylate synthase [Dehalococcoidia bacterium]
MKVIHEPTIYVVGRQMIDQSVVTQFLADHETAWVTDSEVGAELLAEVAGRICYMSFGTAQGRKTNRDYLDNIIESGDGSVIEHAVWDFIITGVSRSFTHELIRHRAGFGYSQLSQRYVDESTADFVEPDIIAEDPDLHAIWQEAVEASHRAYIALVERLTDKVNTHFRDLPRTDRRKMARQAARSVLPNATETKIFVSANARALRHFIELRGAPYADPEIRSVAVKMLGIMQREAPNIFHDFETYDLPDGTVGTRTPHHKV